MMNLLKRYPITSFFVLAFLISWSIRISMTIFSIDATPLKLLAEFGPTIAALIVTGTIDGKAGIRLLLNRVRQWRVNFVWYILVLFVPAALQFASIGVFVLLGGPGAQFHFPGLLLPVIFTIGILLSMGEEIGWRGFALPRLQNRSNPLLASLIIGALWGIWHIPGDLPTLLSKPSLLAESSTYIAYAWFMGMTLIGSVLMTWVYNRTRGSILLIALFHFGLAGAGQFYTLLEKPGQFSPDDLALVLMGIIAVIIAVIRGLRGANNPSGEQYTQEHVLLIPLVEKR